MKRALLYLYVFVSSLALHAGEAKISFKLILTPVISQGIEIDSIKLILFDEYNNLIRQEGITGDTITYMFESLDSGKYTLTVQLYQQNCIFAENSGSGYVNSGKIRDISGYLIFACAYPIWNIPGKDNSYYCLHHGTNPHYHNAHKIQLRHFGDYFNVKELHNGANCCENNYFAAYPLHVHFTADEDSSELVLFTSLNWDVSFFPSGIYLLEISFSDKRFIEKVII